MPVFYQKMPIILYANMTPQKRERQAVVKDKIYAACLDEGHDGPEGQGVRQLLVTVVDVEAGQPLPDEGLHVGHRGVHHAVEADQDQVLSLSSFEGSCQLLTNEVNQVSSVSLIMTPRGYQGIRVLVR